MKPVKEGKVREIYDNGDSLIMVATDRISCFDVILHNTVTNKGKVLTQMSKFWFDLTQDILPNHMITTDVKEMPEYFQSPEFDGKTMMCRKLTMLPLECIVRGYITGSGWASYKENGTANVSNCQRAYRNPRNCRSRSILLPQKQRLVTTTKTSPTNRALITWRNISRARAQSTLQSFVTAPSLFTKSAQTMLTAMESSLPTPNLSLVSMRTAISLSVMRC